MVLPPCPPLALIVAVADNGVIGADGRLPWHIPEDLAWFKARTAGKPLIMGRKTWDSLPRKPLPGRPHVILSRARDFRPDVAPGAPVSTATTLEAAIAAAAAAMPGAEEIMIIGGADIFALAMPRVRRIYLTEVHGAPAGDVHMPALPCGFVETFRERHPPSGSGGLAFSFVIRDRLP